MLGSECGGLEQDCLDGCKCTITFLNDRIQVQVQKVFLYLGIILVSPSTYQACHKALL